MVLNKFIASILLAASLCGLRIPLYAQNSIIVDSLLTSLSAAKDSTTKDLAETWYVAGLIGNKQSEIEYKKAILNQKFDTLSKGKAMMESYDYFMQTIKLDMVPDAKGKVKPKFAKDIKNY